MSPATLRTVSALFLVIAGAAGRLMAMTAPPVPLTAMAGSAARIFRGVCVAAEAGFVEYRGARIAATTYTFEIREHLKGGGAATVTFRQVGTARGGASDLGRAAGLPVYEPGLEYVIFLLPESAARLTSPAGAGRGALVVRDGEVAVPADLLAAAPPAGPPGGGGRPQADGATRVDYGTVRAAILQALGGARPARR